jgi:nucleotide-binding universal stress UspA family protein
MKNAVDVKHILCAVRARRRSVETVSRAIDMALDLGARLTFAYVVDAEFQAHATIGPLSIVYRELVEMSQFVMLILCDRAHRRGVKEVHHVVRHGNVRKQLLQVVAELQPDVLVLGEPGTGPVRPAFRPPEFQAFLAELEQGGELQVVLVPAPASNSV